MFSLISTKLFSISLSLIMLILSSACQPLQLLPVDQRPSAVGLNETVDEFFNLYQAVEPIPLLSQTIENLSYADAYTFQESLSAQFEDTGDSRVGYKLGLTGPQRPFGAEEPLYGRIHKSMILDNQETVQLSHFVRAMMELEIAFIFENDLDYPATPESLSLAISHVAPAVELPDLLFADMENLSWLDLIAIGVAPRRVIVGDLVALDDIDVNEVSVQASYNGEASTEGLGANVMGDQWVALDFLAEKLNDRGVQIRAGDIVITGSMSPMVPINPGQYEVDYGSLGQIAFEVAE
ncbi:MAG: fumarylacetoacetate hydrolase family protein [Chloroflexota bacterium]